MIVLQRDAPDRASKKQFTTARKVPILSGADLALRLFFIGGDMTPKRYYWMKLQADFFSSDDIKLILSQENGPDYVIFWQKLLLKAITQREPGLLRYKENIPYDEKMLATITDTNVDIVRSALKLFVELGMINLRTNGDIWIEQVNFLLGTETEAAIKKRQYRAKRDKQKTLTGHCPTELEIDIKKDIEKEEKTDSKNKYLEYVSLSKEEYEKLMTSYGQATVQDFIERLNDYIGSKGKKYKSHYFTIKNWMRRDGVQKKEPVKKMTAEQKTAARHFTPREE